MTQAYPLSWPAGWPRTPERQRERGRFATPFGAARDGTIYELSVMGVARHEVVISTNVPLRRDGFPYATRQKYDDPGVAVYFLMDGVQRCIPCDRWTTVEANLQAIRKTIEALRGINRWGAKAVLDAAFAGFAALPAEAGDASMNWWGVLGVTHDASWEEVMEGYRAEVRRHHPDFGGDVEQFHLVREAYEKAREEHWK